MDPPQLLSSAYYAAEMQGTFVQSNLIFSLHIHLFQTSFGLKDADLFEPSHLYDFSDFAIVLQTLSVLSNSSKVKAARPDIPPWSWSLHNGENLVKKSGSNFHISKSLKQSV